MKYMVMRFELGTPVQPGIMVELSTVEHRTTYADVLAKAGITVDDSKTQLMFGHPGNTFFSGNTSLDSYVEDGETIGVFDSAIFKPVTTRTKKSI